MDFGDFDDDLFDRRERKNPLDLVNEAIQNYKPKVVKLEVNSNESHSKLTKI